MKYKLTDNKKEMFGKLLYQIESLINFSDVKIGDLGGFIEAEINLSQENNAWVFDNARVSGNAQVYGDARVSGNAQVYGDAWVFDNARVYDDAWVSGDARVSGNAQVYGDAWVFDNARVYDDARVYGNAQVSGNAWVSGDAEINRDNDIIWFSHFGSCTRTTTIFKTKDNGLKVNCGCFNGTLLEFKKQIKKTHGDNKFAKEYLAICKVAKIHFKKELEEV